MIGFLREGTVAEVEIMTPDLDVLDRIVYATAAQLRRIDSPTSTAAPSLRSVRFTRQSPGPPSPKRLAGSLMPAGDVFVHPGS